MGLLRIAKILSQDDGQNVGWGESTTLNWPQSIRSIILSIVIIDGFYLD